MRALFLEDKRDNPYIRRELVEIAYILGYNIAEKIQIRKNSGRYRISDYKIKEIREKAMRFSASKIIIEPRLPPSQELRIIKETKKETLDRIMVILELFERHAGSREAKLQIELARMKHSLPLIKEIVNQAKRGEMPGFLAGGAQAMDKYYSFVKKKIAITRRRLEEIRRKREVTRKKRRKLGKPFIAIVGYANAGKTTIFNKLTGYDKPVGDKPFTTLSPKTGRYDGRRGFFATDTVGFLIDVPPEIIEAFYSTLEEIVYSDLLLFVLDSSENPDIMKVKIREGARILSSIDSKFKPTLMVMNKADLIDKSRLEALRENVWLWSNSYLPNIVDVVIVSGKTGWGIKRLVEKIWMLPESRQEYSE